MSGFEHTDDLTPPPAPTATTTATVVPEATAPRTRWASIIWGLVFAAIAMWGIWTLSADDRREDLAAWVGTLTPATIGGIAVLTLGALVLLLGAIGLIRRGQRRAAR